MELLKIEWLKIKKYPAFWWMLGIVALTYPGINYMFYNVHKQITERKDMTGAIAKSLLGNPFAFPETWHSVAFFSSIFVCIPAILVIMIITNEYSYKTHRQNIIDGWSRHQFVTSKILDVLIISFVATLMYLATAAGYGFTIKDENKASWQSNIQFIPLFFLQSFCQLSIAFFLGFVIRKAFIALGVFVFYNLIIENLLEGYLRFKQISIRRFLPFEISDRLIPQPKFMTRFVEDPKAYDNALGLINEHVVYSLVFVSVIWLSCYFIYSKRDL